METVRLLDSYRLAVARDGTAVRLLAFLQRDGAQTDVHLSQKTHLALHETRNKLTELFRANFVRLLEDRRYATTDIAEQVLASLGIADAVAVDALESTGLSNADKQLLVAFFIGREHEPAEWRQYVSAAAKSAKRLELDATLSEETRARLWYAILAGLDPATHELGSELACRRVYEHADLKAGNVLIEFKHFAERCQIADVDRARSNEFVTTGKRPASLIDTEVTLALTLTRLLASALSRYTDDGLMAAAMTSGVNEQARAALRDWTSPFQAYLNAINTELHSHLTQQRSNVIDTLCDNLLIDPVNWRFALPAQGQRTEQRSSVIELLRSVETKIRNEPLSRRDTRVASGIVARIQNLLPRTAYKRDLPKR